MTSHLTILNITKLDGYYRYSLKRPHDIAAIPAGEVVVDADAVALLTAKPTGVAAALNGEVVRRAAWPQTPLADGDEVEVVTAVQGG